jgi:hypothetical protein
MANTLSTSLILDTISKKTQTYLGHVIAPFAAFSTDFSDEKVMQGKSVQIPVATAGGATQTNPTNWESGDSTITPVSVTVNQYSQSMQLSPRELNSGFRLEQLIDVNLQAFGNKLLDIAFAPLTVTNFTNFGTVAQGSLAGSHLKTARAAVAKNPIKNLILDSVAYAQLLPTSLMTEYGPKAGLAGFDAIYENTRWTGAGTNVYGFAGGPNAIALYAGLPEMVSEGMAGFDQQVVSIQLAGRGSVQGATGPSLQVMTSTWLSAATRTRWVSFDVMFGAAATGDVAAGYLLKSA